MVRASRGRGSCVVVAVVVAVVVVAAAAAAAAAVGDEGGTCDGPGVVFVAWVFGTVVVPVVAVFWLGWDRGWGWEWDCPAAEELGGTPFVCAVVAMVAVCD